MGIVRFGFRVSALGVLEAEQSQLCPLVISAVWVSTHCHCRYDTTV